VEVAERLKTIGRASDIVARIGGDEFMFALNNIGSARNAGQIAEKIIAALSLPFDLKGRQCHIGVSIGVALYPDDAEDIQALIRGADEAMYLAKQSGKNTFRYYADMLREGQGDLASMTGSP
jgi:diguanylate cyclase (GGDEF)-like protein